MQFPLDLKFFGYKFLTNFTSKRVITSNKRYREIKNNKIIPVQFTANTAKARKHTILRPILEQENNANDEKKE